MRKNTLLQTVAIVAAGLVLGIVANGFAGRQRRLMLPGYYPNARTVPERRPAAPVAPRPAAPATATVAEATPVPVPTTTTGGAAGFSPPKSTDAAPIPVGLKPPAPQDTPPVAPPEPAADPLARFQPHPDKPYIEISGDDTAVLHSKGVLFLDARRTSVFEEGHIAGARPFSVWESDIDEKVNALYEERSDPAEQNRPIVIYCSGGACEDSHMLAQKLWGIQFNNVYVYKDGFPDWQKRGGAVKTGGQQ